MEGLYKFQDYQDLRMNFCMLVKTTLNYVSDFRVTCMTDTILEAKLEAIFWLYTPKHKASHRKSSFLWSSI